MKLFRKLMAGAMAIAMLSAYTVAFATGTVSGSTTSGSSATVSGVGSYAGAAEAVFLVKLPTTGAAAQALAFTVDPEETIESSAPANAIGSSTYGTVIFSTVSGSATQNTIYKNESAPMKVVNMSSVDVTVNMFASVSATKMTLSTTSGFTADSTEHLYLAVKVATVSGGTATDKDTKVVSALGARDDTVLKCAAGNYKSVISGGVKSSLVSGAATAAQNLSAANALPEDSWNAVQYTVVGASNGEGKADWQINGLNAPNLTITWKIDPSNVPTYEITEPTNTSYTALLDKKAYKSGEDVTLYVKPTSDKAKLSSVTFKYVAVNAEGKTQKEATVRGTIAATPTNGVYKATFTFPTDMSRSTSPKGDVSYKEPSWEMTVSS